MTDLVENARSTAGPDLISRMLASEATGSAWRASKCSARCCSSLPDRPRRSTLGCALHHLATHSPTSSACVDQPSLLGPPGRSSPPAFAAHHHGPDRQGGPEICGSAVKAG